MFTNRKPFPAVFYCLLLTLLCSNVFAQRQVTGKVTSRDDNQPLAGATVLLKGTSTATQTNADGSFSITVSGNNAVLVFSSIGFEQQEITVRNQTVLSVALRTLVSGLDEIVITGYTAQRKKEITGAVSVIKTDELTKVASPSFLQQAEGRASGIQVTASGAPGDGASLRIRGISTFTNGAGNPLIVIDGVQIRGAFQNSINPNDIESIQILKDAATTASYGIGANNGVIIITTKKGKAGQAKVAYSAYAGVQSAVRGYDKYLLSTAQEYADLVYQSYKNPGLWPQDKKSVIARLYGVGPTPVIPQYINPIPDSADQVGFTVDPSKYNYPNNLIMRASPGTNWWDALFHTAPIMEHNLNVSGGSERGRYFFSVNYFDQDGTMRYTDFKRYTVRANTEFKVKGFTFGENLSAAFSNGVGQRNGNQVEQNNINEGVLKMQPIIPIYDIQGNWGGTKAGFGNGKNGLAQAYRNKDNRGESFRLLGNVYGEVNFLQHFTARVSYGVDFGTTFRKAFQFIDVESNEPLGSNGFTEALNRYRRWIFTQQVTYNNNFGDHALKATAVHEAQLNTFRNINGGLNGYFLTSNDLWYLNTGLADPATRQVNSTGNSDNAKESYLGRVEYGYQGKYLLNLTARYDQSSNFAADKGQLFGGVGAAWRISDENFMKGVTWVNDLKFRAAYGVTGNDAIDGNSNYSSFGGGAGTTFYDINGANTSATTGYTSTQFGLPVVWEKQKQLDIGVDAFFFHNRLEVTLDYYNRTNKDFLFQPQLPGTFPYDVGRPFRNIGKLSNKGVEFNATWREQLNRDWTYDININATFNKNNIDELAPDLGINSFFAAIPESRIGPLVRHEVNHPMGTFYGYIVDGIYQSAAEVNNGIEQDGKAVGRFRWKDVNGDKKITNDDKVAIGDPNPGMVYGFSFNVGYKNFDLSLFMQGTAGNEIFNYTRYFTDFFGFSGNRSKRMLYESWTPTRTNAKLPLLDVTDNYSFQPSSYYVENASYLRCKVLQLAYKVPPNVLGKIGIDNLRFYVQAQNLFTLTKYGGLDPTMGTRDDGANASGNAPEQWSGVDFGNYPSSRIFMFGLNLGF